MKSVFTFCLLLLAGLGVFAQQNHAITGMNARPAAAIPASSSKIATVDTLIQYLDRATAFYLLSAGSSGYVLGTSTVSTETAMHYDGLGSTTVTEIMLFSAHKNIVGNADSMVAKVYSTGPDSMPLVQLGSGKFSVADADTSGSPLFIPVNATAAVGDFAVSIEYGGQSYDDTLVILSSNPVAQGGGPDGGLEKRCRQFTVQGWLRANEIWTIAGNGYDADAMIIPIVDFLSVGVDQHVGQAGLNIYPAFPSPSSSQIQIVWSNSGTENVDVMVYDQMGRTVIHNVYGDMGADQQKAQLSTENWAAGTYYYTVSNGRSTLASKFVVQH